MIIGHRHRICAAITEDSANIVNGYYIGQAALISTRDDGGLASTGSSTTGASTTGAGSTASHL